MRLTIKRKLFLGFGLAAALTASMAGVAHWAQVRAQATQNLIAKTSGMQTDLEHLISYVRGVTVLQRAYLISGDENAIAGIPALRLDAKVVTDRVTASIAGDAELQDHFDRYMDEVKQRIVFVNKLNAARKDQGAEAARALFSTGEDDRLLGAILGEFDAMKSIAATRMSEQETENDRLQSEISWIESVSVLLALLLLTGIAVTLTRSISRNVEISVDLVGAMAEKDLSMDDGQPASDDELAVAIQAINRMKQAMAEALGEVARSSSQVAAAGTEIEATANQIAETTHEEQRNVEQFASSVAEMNVALKDVAEHSERASQAAIDAVASATEGASAVRMTQEAMNRISDSVHTASIDIATLGKETESIGEVVRIIQEIAEQTNLLALNAAIEAARAGEQGKGFAVVAQEVRVLAERTAKFTKEIADKVESVQQGASRAVQSMQQGETVVTEGVSQFNLVSSALETITQRVETAQHGISMIATATTQQSSATSGLTENIHHISDEVNQSTTQVDQTATACAELAKLAASLQQVVDGFQLPENLVAEKGYQAPVARRLAA